MLSRLVRCAVAATLAVAAAVPAAVTPPAAHAQECPAVVVVAARGSGQNDRIYPTNYGGARVSNGWEGESIRAMLLGAESRYRATHGGESLMKDVDVLGLQPQYYPATYPIYRPPVESVPTTAAELFSLVIRYASPVAAALATAGGQFLYSVETGNNGVMAAIDSYEASTGCRPQYLLAGFSQGAMIIANHESELARRGQLAGVVTFGDGLTRAGDPSVVGVSGAGGPLGWAPLPRATANRITYCLPLDAVCDLSAQTLYAARPTGGSHGLYFLTQQPWDDQVFDAIGRYVDQVRYR